ncbi:hypothetical protein A3Q56_03740 [Intoshia linei]|uniref:Receptor protein-tyrosine kinase n=1 Tax=Intoshia linei TaxID=1819745 RepID=A0A177B2N1_9BILA|nr:hypothetical protein A3Q56_03740 [Intoshia linei]
MDFEESSVIQRATPINAQQHSLYFVETPSPQTIHEGQSVTLHCRASSPINIRFWWTMNGKQINASILKKKDKINSRRYCLESNLHISHVDRNKDAGIFRCMAHNMSASSSGPIMSRGVKLNILWISTKATLNLNDVKDSIYMDQRNTSYALFSLHGNNDIILQCIIGGNPKPKIMWFFNGKKKPRLNKEKLIIYQKNGKYNNEVSGVYECRGVNVMGFTKISGYYTIAFKDEKYPMLDIENFEPLIYAKRNEPTTIKCSFKTLSSKINIEWYHQFEKIDTSQENNRVNIDNLLISSTKGSNSGIYTCRARYNAGNIADTVEYTVSLIMSCNIFNIDKISRIEPFEDLNNMQQIMPIGAPLNLKCVSEYGLPFVKYKWHQINSENKTNLIVNKQVMMIRKLSLSDSGVYVCTIENIAGSYSQSVTISITKKPRILRNPNNVKIHEHLNTRFKCLVDSDNHTSTYITWQKDQKDMQNIPNTFVNRKKGILEISSVTSDHEGRYRCLVHSSVYKTVYSKDATLYVIQSIKFLSSFEDQVLNVGDKSSLECYAQSEFQLTTRWFREANISGSQNFDQLNNKFPLKEHNISKRVKLDAGLLGLQKHVSIKNTNFDALNKSAETLDTNAEKALLTGRQRSKSELVFDPIKFTDGGMYTCQASDSSETIYKNINLIIIDNRYAELKKIERHSKMNSEVILECMLTNYISSKPVVTWHVPNNLNMYNSEIFEIYSYGKLKIRQFSALTEGVYTCEINMGKKTKIIMKQYEIKVIMKFETENKKDVIKSQSPLRLSKSHIIILSVVGSIIYIIILIFFAVFCSVRISKAKTKRKLLMVDSSRSDDYFRENSNNLLLANINRNLRNKSNPSEFIKKNTAQEMFSRNLESTEKELLFPSNTNQSSHSSEAVPVNKRPLPIIKNSNFVSAYTKINENINGSINIPQNKGFPKYMNNEALILNSSNSNASFLGIPTINVENLIEFNIDKIDRKNLETVQILGSGKYGDIFLSQFNANNNIHYSFNNLTCMAKSLLSHNNIIAECFINEMKVLCSCNHENIVKVIGCCSESVPFVLLIEYSNLGVLDNLLSDEALLKSYTNTEIEIPFTVDTKLKICLQISLAVAYLHQMGYFHGDIAARNIIISSQGLAKLSFIGCNTTASTINSQYANEFPSAFRWWSPERLILFIKKIENADGMKTALSGFTVEYSNNIDASDTYSLNNCFRDVKNKDDVELSHNNSSIANMSIESEIWTFGVFVYEVFTEKYRLPYWPLNDEQFIKSITTDRNYRLDNPKVSINGIHQVLDGCFQYTPSQRLSIEQIISFLKR